MVRHSSAASFSLLSSESDFMGKKVYNYNWKYAKNIQIGWGSQEVAQYPQHMKNLSLPTPPLSGRLNSITKVLWSPENTQWMAGSRKDLSKTYSCPLEQCSFLSSPNCKPSLLATHDTSQLGIPGRNKIAKHYVDQVGGTQARK